MLTQHETREMQRLIFTGCVELFFTYFECAALAFTVNIGYIGHFLRKYGFMYVESRLVSKCSIVASNSLKMTFRNKYPHRLFFTFGCCILLRIYPTGSFDAVNRNKVSIR
jgi:hypothetical protein